jgi:hypothetical protein
MIIIVGINLIMHTSSIDEQITSNRDKQIVRNRLVVFYRGPRPHIYTCAGVQICRKTP